MRWKTVFAVLIACAAPAGCAEPALAKKHIDCRGVPAQAYQWSEDTVLQYAQTYYRLTPTQLRVLKFCIEHHR